MSLLESRDCDRHTDRINEMTRNLSDRRPWANLGLERNASASDVDNVCKKKKFMYHPDKYKCADYEGDHRAFDAIERSCDAARNGSGDAGFHREEDVFSNFSKRQDERFMKRSKDIGEILDGLISDEKAQFPKDSAAVEDDLERISGSPPEPRHAGSNVFGPDENGDPYTAEQHLEIARRLLRILGSRTGGLSHSSANTGFVHDVALFAAYHEMDPGNLELIRAALEVKYQPPSAGGGLMTARYVTPMFAIALTGCMAIFGAAG